MLPRNLRYLAVILSLGLASAALAQSPTPFVAPDFKVPAMLETTEFRVRMLKVTDVVKDYDAVMTSVAHLRKHYQSTWPEGMSLEENLIDLGWHQKEFMRRTSFAYTVIALDESRVLGCLYINPTRKRGYDANITMWARQSELASGLEDRLVAAVKEWIAKEWPFKNPAYPGLTIDRAEFTKIPDEKR